MQIQLSLDKKTLTPERKAKLATWGDDLRQMLKELRTAPDEIRTYQAELEARQSKKVTAKNFLELVKLRRDNTTQIADLKEAIELTNREVLHLCRIAVQPGMDIYNGLLEQFRSVLWEQLTAILRESTKLPGASEFEINTLIAESKPAKAFLGFLNNLFLPADAIQVPGAMEILLQAVETFAAGGVVWAFEG